MTTPATPILELRGISVNYGGIRAIENIDLVINQGEVVTLIGANGAGKSTTLRAISRLVNPISGQIWYDGKDITRARTDEVVQWGIAQSPEGRRVLSRQSVLDNLKLGAYTRKDRGNIEADIQKQFDLFPRLAERRSQMAGTLSGGEQQMLAIARALLSKPKFLMLDEPSLGIAPLLVKSIFEKIVEINRTQGLTILLVEQNANLALEVSSYGYVLETGKVILEGPSAELKANPQVQAAYLGI